MRIKFWQSLSAAMAIAVIATPAFGQVTNVVVNDSFTDGDRAVTGMSGSDIEIPFFTTSASNAIESNAGSVGLVTGSSGRQIHGIFPTQSLLLAGDTLSTYVTFTTPATVGSSLPSTDPNTETSDDLRIGLFDTLGQAGLSADISASSGTPNPLLNGLAGYAIELDVDNDSQTGQDINIRRSDPSTSGRLLGTNTGISNFSSGGDLGFIFQPNTTYRLHTEIERDAASGLLVTSTFDNVTANTTIGTFSDTDAAPASFDFGFLGLGASTNAFGSSSTAGEDDNGIDINNVTINFTTTAVVPEPSSLALLGLMGCAGFIRRRR